MTPQPNELDSILETAARLAPDPSKGLPDPLFRFVLKLTPMINVDLLVRNDSGEHLLAWREDPYGKGWHIPGGIIRFNESIRARVAAVARDELAATVTCADMPVDVRQFFHARGHFISLLFLCRLDDPVSDRSLWHIGGAPRNGQIRWIRDVPADIYSVHAAYADWLNGKSAG